MLKRNPANRPTDTPATAGPLAAPDDAPVPGVFATPVAPTRAALRPDQRESPTRRLHRLRMKALFARAASAG